MQQFTQMCIMYCEKCEKGAKNLSSMQRLPFVGRIRALQRLFQNDLMSVLLTQLLVTVGVRVNQLRQRSKRFSALDSKTFLITFDLDMHHFVTAPASTHTTVHAVSLGFNASCCYNCYMSHHII